MLIHLAFILSHPQQTIFKMSNLSFLSCYSHHLCCRLAAHLRMNQVKGFAGGLDTN